MNRQLNTWTGRMAWRDSRGSRRRLALFLSSMVLGVAALVAINSFGENLERSVDEQARQLLGADLSLERDQPFAPETEALIDSIGGETSRRVTFSSMVLAPEAGRTRLATIRALEGAYPFYGEVVTDPPAAATTYLTGQDALVDGTLMEQFGLSVGDSVQVGARRYEIAGRLLKTPRESNVFMALSPRVYLPLARLDTTLLGFGSRADYEVFFKFEDGRDVEALVAELEPHLQAQRVGTDTVEEEKENWGEALANLYRFLSLAGFVALLLGGLGVASAVHVYVKQRVETVAVLRCLGAKAWQTFGVYLLQAAALGLLGGVLGCLLGIGLQWLVPAVLADFLPIDVDVFVSWPSVALGLGIGVGVTLLFALLPLLAVRRISPLRALRVAYEGDRARDPLRLLVYGLLAAAVAGFAILQAPTWGIGLWYALGVGVVFGLLALVAKGIMRLARRLAPPGWAYPWRQGLANLYRPNNQTLVLMLALGFGTFLILTILLVQRTLLEQVRIAGGEDRPNLVLFDVQSDQLDEVTETVEEQGLPVLDRVPLISMRLEAIQGRTIEELRADSTVDLTWAHQREWRPTYRDHLVDSERLVRGTFTGRVDPGTEVAPVSLEQDVAETLGVGIGDTLTFDVQGVSIRTVVGSLREVDWGEFRVNFLLVFPRGVIDEAPQSHVLLTRTADDQASANLQRAVVQAFPNVSAIDLSLVLETAETLFSRVAVVIRFMALFSILTGLLVLAGAVTVSRYQRIGESVLLKTLGASRRQVLQIQFIEYLFLGLLASLTGIVLALGGGWALAFFVFDTSFVAAPGALLATGFVVTALTIGIGLLNSRGIYARPPLEVLRVEG